MRGKMNGRGHMLFQNRNTFTGELKDNKFQGVGVLKQGFRAENVFDIVYVGGFVNDEIHGWGTMKFREGNQIESHFRLGKPVGKGLSDGRPNYYISSY